MTTVIDLSWVPQAVVAGLVLMVGWFIRGGIVELKADLKALLAAVGAHQTNIRVLETRVTNCESEIVSIRAQIQQLERRSA